MKYLGYCPDCSLPYKKGQQIVVPAGTYVKSTNPKYLKDGKYGGFTLKRKQTVTIHHFMPGQTVSEAEYQKDFQHYYPNAPIKNLPNGENGRATCNPCAVWVGSGGYWHEVDINDTLEINNVKFPKTKILYAEDDCFMAQAVLDFFEYQEPEIQIVWCENGKEAWDKFLNENFAAILTDYRMPYMTGEELAEKVRSVNKNIPIILMSSMTQDCKNRSLFNVVMDKTDASSKLTTHLKQLLGLRKEIEGPATTG